MPALDHIRGYHDSLTAIRQDLHAHPELGLEEHRTAAIVAAKLEEWGIEVHRGVGQAPGWSACCAPATARAASACAPTWTRCRWRRPTTCPIAASPPGRMHACGHDGHTTMLLGAARYLAETRDFNGTVHLIFQPGEEGVGGALAMLDDKPAGALPLRRGLRDA